MGSPTNTGDGIIMAANAGADLWHMDTFAAPSGYALKAPGIDYVFLAGYWATGLPTKGGFIRIAGDNRRYADEVWEMEKFGVVAGKWKGVTPNCSIDSHGKYVSEPYPTPIHIIFDDVATQNRSLILDTQSGYGWASVVANYAPDADVSAEVAKGWVSKADTISELATAMGRDPAAVGQTVDEWNIGCANGTDAVCGRTSVLVPIQTPPFYAIELKPMLLNTQGGPVRNTKAQVLDKSGNPIPRLYEAGEMGDMFSWFYECCHNVFGCYAFGQIAGKNAAAETPWS